MVPSSTTHGVAESSSARQNPDTQAAAAHQVVCADQDINEWDKDELLEEVCEATSHGGKSKLSERHSATAASFGASSSH